MDGIDARRSADFEAVIAAAADQRIVAYAAQQSVIAVTAVQRVGPAATDDAVGLGIAGAGKGCRADLGDQGLDIVG